MLQFEFKGRLASLREHMERMRRAARQMESIAKLTHSGKSRAEFQNAVDSIRKGLKQQLSELILVLEGVEKSLKHSGAVSDADPATREKFCELLKHTQGRMPSVTQGIQELKKILAEQVSTKRLVRAQVYHAYDRFSSGGTVRVLSQEDAQRVLSEFEEAVLGVSGFCAALVLVGIQLDEASLLASGEPEGGLETMEEIVQDIIQTLKLANGALGGISYEILFSHQ